MRFTIGEQEMAGLRNFRELCRSRMLLAEARPLVTIDPVGEITGETE